MKKLMILVSIFIFFSSLSFSSPQEGYYDYSFSRLSYVKGDVFIQRASDLGYEEGIVNLPLIEGDKLATREGKAEVHFGRRNYVRLNSFSQLDFAQLPEEGNDLTKLHLLAGEIFLRINFLDREKDFEVHTPDASFYILEEGLYRFNVRESMETELSVYEGTAEAAGEEGSILVQSKERLTAVNGRFQSDPVSFYAAYEGDFAAWNRSRDAFLNQMAARRYLPTGLYEYETELAANGRWIYERPYGYVWVPYVYHSQWQPYFYGKWVWYPITGWTWVSYEPWGWCVYHYGRWHWRAGLGWYWIPTRYWGPAWVHWYSGYDYVGWSPLSYFGYPVVIVNNHFYGHYYNRYYPLNSRALVVVRRNQLQAPRISRVALDRNNIVRLGEISLSSRQPSVQPQINKLGIQNQAAKKVFSQSGLRPISRNYSSTQRMSSSRLSSSSYSKRNIASHSIKRQTYPSSKSISINSFQGKSRFIVNKTKMTPDTLSKSSSSLKSHSMIKSYPSRKKAVYGQQLTYSYPAKTRISAYLSQQQSRSQSFYSKSSRSSVVKHFSSQSSGIIFKKRVSSSYSWKDAGEGQRYIRNFSRSQQISSTRTINSVKLRPSSYSYFSSSKTRSSYVSPKSYRSYSKSYYSSSKSYSPKISLKRTTPSSAYKSSSSSRSLAGHFSYSSSRSSKTKIKRK